MTGIDCPGLVLCGMQINESGFSRVCPAPARREGDGRRGIFIAHRDRQIVEADAAAGLGGGAGPENVEGVEVESQPADVALALVDRPRHRTGVRRRRGITGVLERFSDQFSFARVFKKRGELSIRKPYLDVRAVLRDGVSRRGRREDAADAEAGGAGARRRPALGAALARREAGSVPEAGRRPGALGDQQCFN